MSPGEQLVTDAGRVGEIAGEIADAGELCFDLEFVSEARFVPELAVLQVSWGDVDEPRTALIDCVAVEPQPIFELIESDSVTVVAHAATQDLSLLATRFGLRARAFRDTQIAAAFLGIGDQIGYGNLVKAVLDIKLDKGAQFTDWLRRPLSDKQLRYARSDVLYLPRIWRSLAAQLAERGRLAWVEEESALLAEACTGVPPEEDAYLSIKGARGLDAAQMGALRGLAAWRQRTALARNKPLGWVVPDKAMVELCRRRAKSEKDLRAIRGIGDGTVRRYGQAILEELARGAKSPVEVDRSQQGGGLSPRGQLLASVVSNLIQSRCAAEGLAPRFAGTRADAEALVAWFEAGAEEPSELPLLSGWRREMMGDDLVAFLRGDKVAAVTTDGDAPLTLVSRTGR